MTLVLAKLHQNIKQRSGWQHRAYLGFSHIHRRACRRAMYYEAVLPHKKKPDLLGLYKCRDGYLWEDDIIAQLREAGFEIKDRGLLILPFRDFPLIQGHIDGLIRINDEWHLLEVKLRNGKNYQRFKEKKIPSHVYDQAQLYLHYLKGQVNKCVLLIKNAETGELYERIIYYNRKHAQILAQLVETMKEAIASRTLPDKDYHYGSNTCKYCPYLESCKLNENPK